MLSHVCSHYTDRFDCTFKLLSGNIQFFGPVAELVFLMHINTKPILLTAVFEIVGHNISSIKT
jgi:hypothetical protein